MPRRRLNQLINHNFYNQTVGTISDDDYLVPTKIQITKTKNYRTQSKSPSINTWITSLIEQFIHSIKLKNKNTLSFSLIGIFLTITILNLTIQVLNPFIGR